MGEGWLRRGGRLEKTKRMKKIKRTGERGMPVGNGGDRWKKMPKCLGGRKGGGGGYITRIWQCRIAG